MLSYADNCGVTDGTTGTGVTVNRPAAVGYAAFWTVYRPVYLIILLLIYFGKDSGYCMYIVLVEIMFGAVSAKRYD